MGVAVSLLRTYSHSPTPIMPTKRPRKTYEATNLPANLEVEEACPAVYTAQTLFDQRPEAYARVVQYLTQGVPLKTIKKRCKVGQNTIAVVRAREEAVITASKKVMRGLLGSASQMAVESMLEKLEADEIPAGVLPIATGILIDKHRQYEGEPSQTIEVKKTVTLDEVKAELEAMKKAVVIEAEIIEPTDSDQNEG